MEVQTYEFEFFQQKVGLKSQANPEFVREVMDLAALKIADASRRAKAAPPHHVAVLALLELAEEYVRAKRKVAEQNKEISEKSSELMKLLEAEVK